MFLSLELLKLGNSLSHFSKKKWADENLNIFNRSNSKAWLSYIRKIIIKQLNGD